MQRNRPSFHPVVPFDPQEDKLVSLDFTVENTQLDPAIFSDIERFEEHINAQLRQHNARYGIGGYGEHRAVYAASSVFNAETGTGEPRRLHLGLDIWGPAGTPVSAPLGGMVHSLAFNNREGDYGATIILLHQLDGIPFYSLYGHLSLEDLDLLEGTYINREQVFGHFGKPSENGHWPPHLHIQLIIDIEMRKGDYPGVCKYSERKKYLNNCPDPDLLVNLDRWKIK